MPARPVVLLVLSPNQKLTSRVYAQSDGLVELDSHNSKMGWANQGMGCYQRQTELYQGYVGDC